MKSGKLLFLALVVITMLSCTTERTVQSETVLGQWNLTLNEGISPLEFEKFILEEFIPEYEKTFEGIELVLLKADRGENQGGYCILSTFKDVEARNSWWPEQGKSSEKAREAMKNFEDMEKKIQAMTQFTGFSDWLVL